MDDGTILLGEKRSIDRTGLVRITQRVFFSSYEEAMGGAFEADEYDGAVKVSANGSGDNAGNWIVDISYEKIADQIGENTTMVEELDFSMKQDPVSAHPDFGTIKESYPWDEATKAFTKTLTSGDDSPVYGTTEYLNFSCIYRQTQTLDAIPDGMFENIGSIDDNVPFNNIEDPASNDERTWLYLAPKISTKGKCFQISQEWMLSGFGTGWIEAIYTKQSLGMRNTQEN